MEPDRPRPRARELTEELGPTLFASDRGGAGYDIYAVAAGGWIERVDALSSDADDTCPYLFAAYERGVKFTELIFVSNRPGGKGGFDLWHVARPRLFDVDGEDDAR